MSDDEKEKKHCRFCDVPGGTEPCEHGVDCSECGEPYEKSECFEDEDIIRYRTEGRER